MYVYATRFQAEKVNLLYPNQEFLSGKGEDILSEYNLIDANGVKAKQKIQVARVDISNLDGIVGQLVQIVGQTGHQGCRQVC
ncbi:MAG: hypothetical protein IK089_07490, partial [Oxalobacter sp.]|nr:hypothetical protein [Oxalobacter sp.]